jgi:TolB-like protein/Tfp pilus assembly protein PilF
VDRKLAAILAADVVGYSRLMAENEADAFDRLRAHRKELFEPEIAKHHGRIFKLMGDGLLAEFGSVVDAVECAAALQREMATRNEGLASDRRIDIRIGVHVGDVIVEGEDRHGDAVNVAARLEQLAEPGGICVSDTVLNHVKQKVVLGFDLRGEEHLKNIAEPVRVFRVRLEGVAEAQKPALPLPDKPSLAVLPFQNLSGDPEQEYFADGISEDLITALSKLRWFFVIARNSSFIYKGKSVDVKHISRELRVRYVLEGSVRKSGNRVRITAQLIDATTGNHLWADRYDGDLTDIFALQDEIAKKVVSAIEPKLLEAEGVRSQERSPEDFGAWDMVIRANSYFWRMTNADVEAAIGLLNRAVERYPDYAPAHSILAFMLLMSSHLNLSAAVSGPQLARAADLGTRATELDDSDPWAHLALGYVAFMKRRTDEAAAEFRRALDLNPNFAAAHGYLGWALAFDGQSDQAIAHLEEAMRMSPHDPQNSVFNVGIAIAHYLAGRYSEAIVSCRRAFQQRLGLTRGTRIYVASLAQAGQVDEARAVLAEMKVSHPDLSIAWIEQNVPYTPRPMARFIEGMRKAGLK